MFSKRNIVHRKFSYTLCLCPARVGRDHGIPFDSIRTHFYHSSNKCDWSHLQDKIQEESQMTICSDRSLSLQLFIHSQLFNIHTPPQHGISLLFLLPSIPYLLNINSKKVKLFIELIKYL